MHGFLISTAIAVAALAAATPAAAQYFPQPQGNAYGYYNDNRGQARRLEARVDRIRRQIHALDRRNQLSNREARRLDRDAVELQYRVRRASLNGLSRHERDKLEHRIFRLERALRSEASDGDRRWRDRDGRWHYHPS